MQLVATKPDGGGLSKPEIKELYSSGKVVSCALHLSEAPDGAGKNGVEGKVSSMFGRRTAAWAAQAEDRC
jgi:hypothetical protein